MDVKTILENDRFASEVGIRAVSWSDGEAVLELDLTEKHLNANGVGQGGVVFTLADTAFAVASNAGEYDTVALTSTVNFIRPATGSRLTAHAETVSQGKTTCCVMVTVTDDCGRTVAKLQCTGYHVNR